MASITFVKTKSELGDGLYFNIEGLKRIGDAVILHGWIVDSVRQLRSIHISKPGTSKTFDLTDGLVRFSRPDVNSAYNAPDSSIKTHFGFVSILTDFLGVKDFENLGIVFVSNNGKAYIENVKITSVASSSEAIPQLLGIIPDSNIDADRCEKYYKPIFDVMGKEAPKAEKAIDETFEEAKGSLKPLLSVIIPLYGETRFELTQIPALAALRRSDWELIFAVDDPRIVTVVRENAQRLSSHYGCCVRVIATINNLGFSGINNFAADLAKAANLLFLNSDCFISNANLIDKAIHWLKNKNAGAVGFRLTYADQTIQHDGMSISKWGGQEDFMLNEHPRRGLPINLVALKQNNDKACMLTAACLLMTKNTFKSVNGFDRAYLRGDFEDSDLCLKLLDKGLKLGIVRDSGIFHLERQTISAQEGGLRTKITLVNSYIYTKKWRIKLQKGLPALEVVV
jgi:GT2 family glycosyltransferase